jgi:hypothetical protein
MDSRFPDRRKGIEDELASLLRTICALGVLQALAVGPTEAYMTEVTRYYESARDICRTGVTPPISAAHEEARRAMEQARARGALMGNFAGLKSRLTARPDARRRPR